LNGLADGKHSLCVLAADPSGHPSGQVCRSWEQEQLPLAAIKSVPPLVTASPRASFTYTSNKAGHPADGSTVSFECRLANGASAACPAAGTTVSGLADGLHELAVRVQFHAALDAAGVTHASLPALYDWTVDTTPPQVAITSGPADGASTEDIA